jgi:hypothetical protein
MRRNCNCAKLVLVFHFVVFLGLITTRVTAKSSPWGTNTFHPWGNKETNKKLSSMLTVDPSKMISLMIRHGGLLIPDSLEKDLDVFAKVCHAEEVNLNIMERKLLVHNFTIHLPDQEDALRIGRVYVHWDSYVRPCVEIEVDDVYILVEFLNTLLTKTNW